jgi:hypothetical protein
MGFMKEWKLAELKLLTDQTLVPLSEPMSRMLRPGRGFNFGMNPGIPTSIPSQKYVALILASGVNKTMANWARFHQRITDSGH